MRMRLAAVCLPCGIFILWNPQAIPLGPLCGPLTEDSTGAPPRLIYPSFSRKKIGLAVLLNPQALEAITTTEQRPFQG